jgi:hypothetical protein
MWTEVYRNVTSTTQIRVILSADLATVWEALAAKKLDLAFNRCLDSGILMSKFQKVDLVSHAADIDSLEDPARPNQ